MKHSNKLFALIFLLSISVCWAELSDEQDSKLKIQAAEDESTYLNASLLLWAQINEDLNTSSFVLDEYVKNNISKIEAMQSIVSTYTLTARTQVNFQNMQPPERYVDYHNYSLNTIDNLRLYLWYLGKFLQTDNPNYAIIASDRFNLTNEFRDKAREETILNL